MEGTQPFLTLIYICFAVRGVVKEGQARLGCLVFDFYQIKLTYHHAIILYFLQVRHTVSVLIDEKESTDTEESGIKDIVVQISWPLKTAAGKYLLYLSEVCDNF